MIDGIAAGNCPRAVTWAGLLAALSFDHARDEPDQSLAQRQREELAAFEAFFTQFERRVTGYLWRMTHEEETACDISQEVFLRAWHAFATLQTYHHPESWLFQVATNLALHHLRRLRKAVGAAVPIDSVNEPHGDDIAGRVVELDQIHTALATLPPRSRSALLLREVYGLSCDEVGQTLGISYNAAKMMLSRARAQFRASYLRAEE